MKIGVDYIGVSAGAVIVRSDRKYFLAKRGPKARDDVGKWEFPGGAVNFYEGREEAAVRNILEKYGLHVTIDSVLNVYDVIDQQNEDHWVSTTYVCTAKDNSEASITNPDKCIEISWFSLEEIQNLALSRITKLNLNDLLDK